MSFSLVQLRVVVLIAFATVVLAVGCRDDRTVAKSSIVVQPDTRPTFALSASTPFKIAFGRGSGRDGLDTIEIDDTGLVELHRRSNRVGLPYERTTLHLTKDQVASIAQFINDQGLLRLGKSYSAPRVNDGTQWILWTRQMPNERSIYFNNAFPDEITAFASHLDSILNSSGQSNAVWSPIPMNEEQDHQKPFWESIK